jgi:hypothetical protein
MRLGLVLGLNALKQALRINKTLEKRFGERVYEKEVGIGH